MSDGMTTIVELIVGKIEAGQKWVEKLILTDCSKILKAKKFEYDIYHIRILYLFIIY
jgi:hypothetical protein